MAGVSEVTGLKLFAPGTDAWRALPTSGADATQSLELARWQLPELLAVAVAEDPNGAPAELIAAPNPYADPDAVAVPVVPELC